MYCMEDKIQYLAGRRRGVFVEIMTTWERYTTAYIYTSKYIYIYPWPLFLDNNVRSHRRLSSSSSSSGDPPGSFGVFAGRGYPRLFLQKARPLRVLLSPLPPLVRLSAERSGFVTPLTAISAPSSENPTRGIVLTVSSFAVISAESPPSCYLPCRMTDACCN